VKDCRCGTIADITSPPQSDLSELPPARPTRSTPRSRRAGRVAHVSESDQENEDGPLGTEDEEQFLLDAAKTVSDKTSAKTSLK
jgi:hypothetical protein